MVWDLGQHTVMQRCPPLWSASSFTLRCPFYSLFPRATLPHCPLLPTHTHKNTLWAPCIHFLLSDFNLYSSRQTSFLAFSFMEWLYTPERTSILQHSHKHHTFALAHRLERMCYHTQTHTARYPWRARESSLHMLVRSRSELDDQRPCHRGRPNVPSPGGNGVPCHRR